MLLAMSSSVITIGFPSLGSAMPSGGHGPWVWNFT